MFNSFGDYLRRSFIAIKDNPILLVPILFDLLVSLIPAALLLTVFRANNFFPFHHKGIGIFSGNLPSNIIMFIALGIIISILLLFIEAGKFNMIKQIMLTGSTNMGDFKRGVTKYTGRFLLGSLVIVGAMLLMGVVLFVGAIIGGMKTILIGLFIIMFIPLIIIAIFISFWQIILVYEDCGPMEAFRLSFAFVKRNFWLVLVINIIQGILTGNNNPNNEHNGNSISIGKFLNINLPFNMASMGVIGFISIVLLLVKSLLVIYLNTLYFVIYDDRRDNEFELL